MNNDTSLVKNKSHFVPPKSNNQQLNVVMESISKLSQQENTEPKAKKSNISRSEKAAGQRRGDRDHGQNILQEQNIGTTE